MPNYNGVELLCTILLGNGLYSVLYSPYVSLEHMTVLVIQHHVFQGENIGYILHCCTCLVCYGYHEFIVIFL